MCAAVRGVGCVKRLKGREADVADIEDSDHQVVVIRYKLRGCMAAPTVRLAFLCWP